MSFAVAMRNEEGVLLAADQLTGRYEAGRWTNFRAPKIRWFPGHRATCVLFPIESSRLLEQPDLERVDDQDLRPAMATVWEEAYRVLQIRLTELPPVDPSWHRPALLVAAYTKDGSRLLIQRQPGEVRDDRELFPGDEMAVLAIGAWHELGDGRQRVDGAPWRQARTIAAARAVVLDLMFGYLRAYEARGGDPDPVIGGPIDLVTITRHEIRKDRFETR